MVVAATCLLIASMFASFAPTPLYPIYDAMWHIGPFGTSVAFAGYPIGSAGSGRCSSRSAS